MNNISINRIVLGSSILPLVLLFPSALQATPVIQEQYDYYSVLGNNVQSLREAMAQLGPSINGQHFDAEVKWHITWHFTWLNRSVNTMCAVNKVNVTVRIYRIMPKWGNEALGSLDLQEKWDTFQKNLTIHEQGHVTNATLAGEEIEKALLNTLPKTTCNELERVLNATGKAIIKKHNQWDVQYDAQTQHGRTQGAQFP